MSGNHRAPWRALNPNGTLGAEYEPRSVITGRTVCHDRAEQDYIEKYGHLGAIPVADDPVPRVKIDVPGAPRYDQAEIEAFANKHSARLSQRELDVYVAFWIERRSYKSAAESLDLRYEDVRDAVKRIRRKQAIRALA